MIQDVKLFLTAVQFFSLGEYYAVFPTVPTGIFREMVTATRVHTVHWDPQRRNPIFRMSWDSALRTDASTLSTLSLMEGKRFLTEVNIKE